MSDPLPGEATEPDPILPLGAPPLGTVLGGRYRLLRLLGEGGMGLVYEALHERLRQPVAVKLLQPRLLDNAEVVARFEREARAASQLRGRNVARVIDVDVSDGAAAAPYMVMELLTGHDLARELRLRGHLPVQEAVGYVMQACEGMIEAHAASIVHRDLKPSNLFLQDEAGERVVKVLDFGISKLLRDDESAVTVTYSTIGTPLYMSPEQVRSAKHVDARTDQWSLAIILFELLAGRPPFTGGPTAVSAAIVADDLPSLRELAPDVPADLEAVVARALQKRPNDRYADVVAFADALAPFGPADARARRPRSSGGTSGSFSSLVRVEVPTLGARDALSPTMPTPEVRLERASAETVAASPAASAVTAAPWSSSRGAGGSPGGRARPLLVAGVVALVLTVGVVVAWVARREPAPMPAPATPSNSVASASASSASTVAAAPTVVVAPPSTSAVSSAVVAPTKAPAAPVPRPTPATASATGSVPSAKPKPPEPPPPKPPNDNPVHL